jgi:hypothetical protein
VQVRECITCSGAPDFYSSGCEFESNNSHIPYPAPHYSPIQDGGAIAFFISMTDNRKSVALGGALTLQDVIAVARGRATVTLPDELRVKIEASRAWMERIVECGQPITFGINTGFGVFAIVHVSGARRGI